MADFPEEAQNAIENHGIIGDMRSAALIADTGSIDFCCWPDFDSPSIFTALLDTNDAGIFSWRQTCPMRGACRFICRTPTCCRPAGYQKKLSWK